MTSSVTLAHVTLSVIPEHERSYPTDCVRVEADGGPAYTVTLRDVWEFYDELEQFARSTLRMRNREKDQ